jgi:hypothetical protein
LQAGVFPTGNADRPHEDILNGRRAFAFICGADHPTTIAFKVAVETGSEQNIKKARTLFLRLKPGERQAALRMIED